MAPIAKSFPGTRLHRSDKPAATGCGPVSVTNLPRISVNNFGLSQHSGKNGVTFIESILSTSQVKMIKMMTIFATVSEPR